MFSRVLVVDDTPVDRQIVGGLLAADGFIETTFAENGEAALECIEQESPRLVLTDLVMPQMDGLEFVRAVHDRHPSLPIVLMTAFGSGEVALEAMRCGAVSYIPKSQLADRLLVTVGRLLGMSGDTSNPQLLWEYENSVNYTFRLPNKRSVIDALLGLVLHSTAQIHFGTAGIRYQLAVALEQALLNAIYRGNLEISHGEMAGVRQLGTQAVSELVRSRRAQPLYASRGVDLEIDITRERVRFHVKDEGNGFDTSRVPRRDDAKTLDQSQGHGLVLMANLMDEMNFNPQGNEVELIKYAA
jgi:CheY-like chemotaxis protein